MALPSATNGTALTTPTCVTAWIEYPFRNNNDPVTKAYHHVMQVKLTSYTPLADDDEMTAADEKPERSPFPDDANAFFIGDSMPSPIDGGMVQFVRSFSQVPATRTEGAGLYGHQFPNSVTGLNAVININSGTGDFLTANNRAEMRFTLTSANAEDLNVGDKTQATTASQRFVFYGQTAFEQVNPFFIIYEKTINGGNFDYKGYMENFEAVKSVNQYSTLTSFTVSTPKIIPRSETKTTNSESIFSYRYVKTNDITTEKLEDKFNVLSRSGSNPNYVYADTNTVSSSTFPTLKEYGGLVFNNGYIQAEPEILNRWRGNIWEIVGRKVAAK